MNPEDKAEVALVLEHYGAVVPYRSGWAKLRCPFHEDRTPSASVNTELQQFKCFPCGWSGDVYDLVMWQEGIDYRAAVQHAESIARAGSSSERTESQRDGTGVPPVKRNPRARGSNRASGSGAYGSQWS